MPHSERYTPTAIALHWLIALAVLVQIKWGWWMQGIPKQPSGPRVDAYNLHKSFGLVILALMVLRILWRWRHPAPALPAMPAWQRRAAQINHGVLYLALFVMPVAGYLGSVFSGYPVRFFGVTLPSWGGKDESLKDLCSNIHLVTSFVLAAAIALHLAAALKHALFDRDGTLARMGIGKAGKRRVVE
ncbi:MAG: cytochrome b [Betaproteobacteria bacterium]